MTKRFLKICTKHKPFQKNNILTTLTFFSQKVVEIIIKAELDSFLNDPDIKGKNAKELRDYAQQIENDLLIMQESQVQNCKVFSDYI
jgi:DNA-binding protein